MSQFISPGQGNTVSRRSPLSGIWLGNYGVARSAPRTQTVPPVVRHRLKQIGTS